MHFYFIALDSVIDFLVRVCMVVGSLIHSSIKCTEWAKVGLQLFVWKK